MDDGFRHAASRPDLPDPSAELVLLSVLVQAQLKTIGPKKRVAFLKEVTDTLAAYRSAYDVVRIRPRSEDAKVREVMRLADAWWAQILGVFSRMAPPPG